MTATMAAMARADGEEDPVGGQKDKQSDHRADGHDQAGGAFDRNSELGTGGHAGLL